MDPICFDKGLSSFHCSAVGFTIGFTLLLIGLAALSAVILPLIKSLQNPKSLVKMLASAGVLVVVFLICFFASSSNVSESSSAVYFELSSAQYQLVGAGLLLLLIVFVLGYGGMLVTELLGTRSLLGGLKLVVAPLLVILAVTFGVQGGLYLTYGILALALLAILGGIVVSSGATRMERWKVAYWLGFFLILGGVAYLISGDEVSTLYRIKGVTSAGESKFIGAGLITFYLAVLAALIGIVFSEINKALK